MDREATRKIAVEDDQISLRMDLALDYVRDGEYQATSATHPGATLRTHPPPLL